MVEAYEKLLHGRQENEGACAAPEKLSDMKALFTSERISEEITNRLGREGNEALYLPEVQQLIERASEEIADLVAKCQSAKRER
jgi:hypothetical protein